MSIIRPPTESSKGPGPRPERECWKIPLEEKYAWRQRKKGVNERSLGESSFPTPMRRITGNKKPGSSGQKKAHNPPEFREGGPDERKEGPKVGGKGSHTVHIKKKAGYGQSQRGKGDAKRRMQKDTPSLDRTGRKKKIFSGHRVPGEDRSKEHGTTENVGRYGLPRNDRTKWGKVASRKKKEKEKGEVLFVRHSSFEEGQNQKSQTIAST